MFGYVHPAQERLSEEDKQYFQGAYCGLCHTLGRRYGFAGRLILNYDLTFLTILLEKETPCRCEKRCVAHPFRKHTCVCGAASMETAADLSVILTWWQLQDGINDHSFFGGLKYRLAALLLRGSYRKARKLRPAFDEATQTHLAELRKLENAGDPTLDRPADTFARLLQSAAAVEPNETRRRVLEQILYHLGRWIYLVDAADDLKQDVSSGNYNPIPLRYGLSGNELDKESRIQLAFTLDHSVRMMAAAFELADFGVYRSLVENVVYQGLYLVGNAVLNGTYRRPKKKK